MAKAQKTEEQTNDPATETGTEVVDMKKFNAPVLKGMAASTMDKGMTAVFLPTTMLEAMELAKLMSQSNFMPAHLRGRPGDCLAVVIQASNWGMNSYAVANKTYFVNDRMAYESQLVNSVVNTSSVLKGRLSVAWDGTGDHMICTVSGTIKGDPEVKKIWQELRLVHPKNSPLWKSAPQMQLAYYTTRMWARLYTPEVLMGVYTPDEMESINEQPDGSQVIPPRPTRSHVSPEAAQRMASEMDRGFSGAMGGGMNTDPEHDQDGVVQEGDGSQEPAETDTPGKPTGGGEEQHQDDVGGQQGDGAEPERQGLSAAEKIEYEKSAIALIDKVNSQGFLGGVDAIVSDYGADLDQIKEHLPERHKAIMTAIAEKREAIKARGKRR